MLFKIIFDEQVSYIFHQLHFVHEHKYIVNVNTNKKRDGYIEDQLMRIQIRGIHIVFEKQIGVKQ